MERVHKTFTGGYTKEKENKPATHVILTIEEYENLKNDLASAEYEAENIKNEYKNKMARYKNECDSLLNNEKIKAEKLISDSQSLLNSAKGEIGRLNELNANLLRISRERANAKRGIKPKKSHNGYIITACQQYVYLFKYFFNGRPATDKFDCWKLKIQSPYDSTIPFNVIKKNIENDFTFFSKDLNLSASVNADDLGIADFKEIWDKYSNFIFKIYYKNNIKASFWEVEYLVKDSISIPQSMVK